MSKQKIAYLPARPTGAGTDPELNEAAGSRTRRGQFAVVDQLKAGSFDVAHVIESLSDGFALYDPENRLVLWNKSFADILAHAKDIMYPGIPFDTLIRKCAEEHFQANLITEQQRDSWIEEARRFHTKGETYERLTPDGKCYLVSRRRTSDGYVSVVWTDITEERRAKEALLESEHLHRALFDHSAQGIVVVTKRKVLMANQTLADVFGLDAPTEVGSIKALDNLVAHSERSRFRQIRQEHFSGNNLLKEFEIQGRHQLGQPLWLHVTITPISWQNEPALQIAFLDITEKKQFTEDLIALKLESLSTMARGIALEFHTIHSAIMSQVRLTKMDAYASGLTAVYDSMKTAEEFGENLDELLKQLLVLCRSGEPFKEPVSVEELLKEALPNNESATDGVIPMKRQKAAIKMNLAARLAPVNVDKSQIVQVLQALVKNGVDAMPFGGKLTLVAENTEVSNRSRSTPLPPGTYVKISVIDQGDGMPESALKRVFDPYFSSGVNGQGTSLATAFSVVKNHGGTITVSSRVGRGTRMNVFLPAGD